VEYVKEHPLLGIGLNHFSHTFPLSYPAEPGNTVYDAHSLYFQVSSQMGIMGIVALGILIAGFLRAWKAFRDTTGFGVSLKFGAMGAFLVITVAGLFDTTLHHGHAVAFSLITGLFFGYQGGEEKREERRGGSQGKREDDGV
jgi:O-antigen ligase